MPNPWRVCTRHSQLSHSGKISILLGGDNFLAFPKEQDHNSTGTALFKSEITNKYLIFGRPNAKIFKWKEPVKTITINKLKSRTSSTSAHPPYRTTPQYTPTGHREPKPLTHPGQRKNNQQTTKPCPYPEPLFPRFLRHPWRKTTPGANPKLRLNGPNNTAPGYKDQEQQPARASELLTKVDGEERNVKNTAPGLNEDGATGTLAPDPGTQLGTARDEFANWNSPTQQPGPSGT